MITNELVPELTNGEFEKFVKQDVALIDFYAEWCMPCVMMGPVIEDLAEEFFGKIKVGKINVDDNSELASRFNISSIPNIILFKDGKIVEQLIGAKTHEEISEIIKKYI